MAKKSLQNKHLKTNNDYLCHQCHSARLSRFKLKSLKIIRMLKASLKVTKHQTLLYSRVTPPKRQHSSIWARVHLNTFLPSIFPLQTMLQLIRHHLSEFNTKTPVSITENRDLESSLTSKGHKCIASAACDVRDVFTADK